MPEQLKDLARGVLAAPYAVNEPSVTLVDASEFSPTGTFTLRLDNPERTLLTVTGRQGNIFQVVHELNMASAPIGALAVQVLSVRSLIQHIEDTTFTKDDIIPISNGGTGASTAEQARINLGVPGIPVPIHQGGTGATTVEGARYNLDVFSKEEVLLLTFPDGTVTLPWPIASGGTGATTPEQARINLGILPFEQQIPISNLILNNMQYIYWRLNDQVTPYGAITMDNINRLTLNAPGGIVAYGQIVQWPGDDNPAYIISRSGPNHDATFEAQVGGNPAGTGNAAIKFHRVSQNVYTMGLRSDNGFVLANSHDLWNNPLLWTFGYGVSIQADHWLFSGPGTQLIAGTQNGTVLIGGNANSIQSVSYHVFQTAAILNNNRQLISVNGANNSWLNIAYVNPDNILVIGDALNSDIWYPRGFNVNGTVGALGVYVTQQLTMRVQARIVDDWGLPWIYRQIDGVSNPVMVANGSHVIMGTADALTQLRGQVQIMDGNINFFEYGYYGSY